MLSLALSGLVLIRNFFEETYICHLHAYLRACFYENYLKFLTSYIYFHLDQTVETTPIFNSRDDGADMLFRNS